MIKIASILTTFTVLASSLVAQTNYSTQWLVSTNAVEYNSLYSSSPTATGVTGLAARKALPATATHPAVLDGPFWAVNRGNKTVSLYNNSGSATINTGSSGPKVLSIPTNGGTPNGIWFNPTHSFTIGTAPLTATAYFVAASDDGSFWGWTPSIDTNKNLPIVVTGVPTGAGYSGITGSQRTIAWTLGTSTIFQDRDFLFVADFRLNQVDEFDGKFHYVTSWDTPNDLKLLGLSVYNVYAISGRRIVVVYAPLQPGIFSPVVGSTIGFAEVYDTDHHLITRLKSTYLNNPWGITQFHGSILIANFENGTVDSYNDTTYAYQGKLLNSSGTNLSVSGLWALDFKLGISGGDRLFWTAGPDHDADGAFGSFTPVSAP